MQKRPSRKLKTADTDLPRSLTETLIKDFLDVFRAHDETLFSYQAECFLSKFVDNLDEQGAGMRRSAAIAKWQSTEVRNEQTNIRLSGPNSSVIFHEVTANRFLDRVSLIIASVIGTAPKLDLLLGGFSGGATTSKRRAQGHPALKFLGKADATSRALGLFSSLLEQSGLWESVFDMWDNHPRVVVGNDLFTVPKSSVIDRVCCKEPDLNIFLQKMFGRQIRSALKRAGIDLNDQRINGDLARIGSVDGSLATIDLSSASDSVSYALVKRVLPKGWFALLDCVRSPYTMVDGQMHECKMFSSMGNGFTFELESLLFYAIARAVAYFTGTKGRISVYGDDIISPSSMSEELMEALLYCGFLVNPDKSFTDGPFRESCGKHWHGGLDVSPFYLRRPIKTVSDLILILNQLQGWASRVLQTVDPRVEHLVRKYRVFVPQSLWGGQDLAARNALVTGHRPRQRLVLVTKVKRFHHHGGLLAWLHSAESAPLHDPFNIEGSEEKGMMRLRANDSPVDLRIYYAEESA